MQKAQEYPTEVSCSLNPSRRQLPSDERGYLKLLIDVLARQWSHPRPNGVRQRNDLRPSSCFLRDPLARVPCARVRYHPLSDVGDTMELIVFLKKQVLFFYRR